MLAVDFDADRGDVAQDRGRDRGRAGKGPAAAVGLERPSQQQRLARLALDAMFGQQSVDRMARRHLELGGHGGGFLAAAHQPGIGAGAERQAERVQQDRLAGAGLAGEHAEAGLELQLEPVDQHDVVDGELP